MFDVKTMNVFTIVHNSFNDDPEGLLWVEVRAVARQLNPHDPLLIEPFCDVKMTSESEKKWRKVDQLS